MQGNCLFSSGFSLLEVLIAMLIMTTALMGVATLQALSLRGIQANGIRADATAQAEALLERFRANHSSAGWAQEFNGVQQQIMYWLPRGYCEYQCLANLCTVSLFWEDHGPQSQKLSSLL